MAETITPHLFPYDGEAVLRGANKAISEVEIGDPLLGGNVYSKSSNNLEILVCKQFDQGCPSCTRATNCPILKAKRPQLFLMQIS